MDFYLAHYYILTVLVAALAMTHEKGARAVSTSDSQTYLDSNCSEKFISLPVTINVQRSIYKLDYRIKRGIYG